MILYIFKRKNSLNDRKRFYFLFVLLHISLLFIFMFLNDLTTPIVIKNFLALKQQTTIIAQECVVRTYAVLAGRFQDQHLALSNIFFFFVLFETVYTSRCL